MIYGKEAGTGKGLHREGEIENRKMLNDRARILGDKAR
jgi:hypothetical protein